MDKQYFSGGIGWLRKQKTPILSYHLLSLSKLFLCPYPLSLSLYFLLPGLKLPHISQQNS